MTKTTVDLDQLCINTIRFLAVDAVEKAKSGHPGLPLGATPMAFTLWDRYLRFNPKNPHWPNRDRFVLSAGHGCAMLYALLHVYGFELSLEELKRFRQWGSKTPGHPEYGHTPGVEATTGPLGQGIGMAVGMAIAERSLAHLFNRPGFEVIDYRTFVLVSDGDLMEGVSSEAASLAGHLRLGKLKFLYDDNNITIDGNTEITFTEDVQKRFEAYGWHVLRVSDGNDLDSIDHAIEEAIGQDERPSLIICKTHIGYGSPKQDSEKAHGEPLGPGAVSATRAALDWPQEPSFYVPEEAKLHFAEGCRKGIEREAEWDRQFESYAHEHPAAAADFRDFREGKLPEGWSRQIPVFAPEDGPMATRDASNKIMNAIAATVPSFLGGSADLATSNKTNLEGLGSFEPWEYSGRNIHFGIREHAMGAAVNGMALSGLHAFGATFLIFSDYMRAAIRLSAVMGCDSIWVFTHDSIFVGEDGPTHEPIEQTMSLRAIPNMAVIRPADANESVEAWKIALTRKGPKALLFTRQKLPILDPKRFPVAKGVSHGAYVLSDAPESKPALIIIGTGSEVHLALEIQSALRAEGIAARVVSIPSWELFREQSDEYRQSVLPVGIPKLSIEAGTTLGWREWVGDSGEVLGLDRFGASAPGETVYRELGFTVDNALKLARQALRKAKG